MRKHFRKKRVLLNRKDLIVIAVLLSASFSFYLFKLIDKYIMPILQNYAETETVTISTMIINESIKENLLNDINVNDIIKTVMNKDNEIISIDFDTVIINKSLSSITESIQTKFKNIEEGKYISKNNYDNFYDGSILYMIPIGVVFGNSILSSLGPKIPVNASLIGDVTSNVKTEVTPYGINNSLIKVYVSIDLNSMIVLPFTSKKVNVNEELLIGMKVVQGKIPEFYGSMYTNSSPLVTN